MSRFFNRMNEASLVQFEKIFHILRWKIYAIRPSENILLDLDSTLLQTYGHQEGEGSTTITGATDIIRCYALTA